MNKTNSFINKIRKIFHKSTKFTVIVSLFSLTNVPSYARTVSCIYNELGRIISVTQANGTAVTYQHDAAGNRAVFTGGGGGGVSHAPKCATTSMTISSSASTDVNYPVSAANILSKCSDADGDTLTVASPAPLMSYTFLEVLLSSFNTPLVMAVEVLQLKHLQ